MCAQRCMYIFVLLFPLYYNDSCVHTFVRMNAWMCSSLSITQQNTITPPHYMQNSAFRVASLLQSRHRRGICDEGESTLAKLTQGVEMFLQHAADVPPVMLEKLSEVGDADTSTNGCSERHDDVDESMDEAEVHLSVVAGVLEPREMPKNVSTMSGLLLPTADNRKALERQKVEEAQAMLNLLAALTANNKKENTIGALTGTSEAEVDDESTTTSDESVVICYADELESDTTSSCSEADAQQEPQRSARIIELN
ncbi:hypothetical protein, conserved [Trypanosoma brucei brucei TREU927]|uniref:Uncharacterized protein n=2 Tax=Trypanozoon TaxID=39700 RepID=Q38DM4_TRYB2|nr:hypothetical protein, conserved [Trypanosoma brucei brucei TREU927]EAN77096.1 hypothetical protein, conserved [Trypanosoma brucei brucei TREU927]